MATYENKTLRKIYDRTTGKCHICGKKLAFSNYGDHGTRSAWEVEHSIPRAKGGSDHGNNLYAAHITCNRSKQAVSTRAARAQHGRTRAPLSVTRRKKAKAENTAVGAGIGAVVGGVLAGPPGVWIGGGIGAFFGNYANPD
jgi:5-methylcytosine-specific restriction endonuclease McrA